MKVGRKPKPYYCPICFCLAIRSGYSCYFTCTSCKTRLVQKAGVLQETRSYIIQEESKEKTEKEYMNADEYESLAG